MKRALALMIRRHASSSSPVFLVKDDGTSTNADNAQRFSTLNGVSRRLHHMYSRHAADLDWTQFPLYEVVELMYDRLPSNEADDEVIDHTKLVWRYTDGREFPIGENRHNCVLVRPKIMWAWRLAQ